MRCILRLDDNIVRCCFTRGKRGHPYQPLGFDLADHSSHTDSTGPALFERESLGEREGGRLGLHKCGTQPLGGISGIHRVVPSSHSGETSATYTGALLGPHAW